MSCITSDKPDGSLCGSPSAFAPLRTSATGPAWQKNASRSASVAWKGRLRTYTDSASFLTTPGRPSEGGACCRPLFLSCHRQSCTPAPGTQTACPHVVEYDMLAMCWWGAATASLPAVLLPQHLQPFVQTAYRQTVDLSCTVCLLDTPGLVLLLAAVPVLVLHYCT